MQLKFVAVVLAAVATKSAVAQCENLCEKSRQPVCGSNNITYPNVCLLKVVACNSKQTITVAKQGVCDCGCPEEFKPYEPQCGSNDVTYANKCNLQLAQCKDATIKLAKEGRCPCPTFCQDIGFPVCGSDGKTYGNECDLKSAACKGQLELTKVSNGACPGTNATKTNSPNTTATIVTPSPAQTTTVAPTPRPGPTPLVTSSSPLMAVSITAVISTLALVLA